MVSSLITSRDFYNNVHAIRLKIIILKFSLNYQEIISAEGVFLSRACFWCMITAEDKKCIVSFCSYLLNQLVIPISLV